jgi:hypothetical protein
MLQEQRFIMALKIELRMSGGGPDSSDKGAYVELKTPQVLLLKLHQTLRPSLPNTQSILVRQRQLGNKDLCNK